MDWKTCRICGIAKPVIEFHQRMKNKDRRHTACKPCAIREQNESRLKPRPILPEIVCATCRVSKPLDEFVRNKNYWHGRNHICKACLYPQRKAYETTGKEKLKAAARKRYRDDPEKFRDWKAASAHGVPPGTYDHMFSAQGGVCAICGRNKNSGKTRFAFDHCHETGRIRGLLCTCCNQALGQLQDSPELFRKAIAYLESPPGYQLDLPPVSRKAK